MSKMTIALISFFGVLMAGIANAKSSVRFNPETLFDDVIRGISATFGKLSSSQLNSAALIFNEWKAFDGEDVRKLVYIIATAMWESRLTPIREIRAQAGTKLYELQNRYWNTGYYGRGYVQLTFEANYRKMATRLGIPDLATNPDLALLPEVAAKIIIIGMYEGIFTGKKLSDYINLFKTDFYNSRRIVNGLDRADKIETYANSILLKIQTV